MTTELRLPQTLRAVGPTELEAALSRELPATKLPLERFLIDGGWPMNAVVRVVGATSREESLRLELSVSFDELVTGCGGGGEERPRLGEFVVVIDRATAIALIS